MEAVGEHPNFERICDKHFVAMFDVARNVVENELEGTPSEEIYRRRRAWRYTVQRSNWPLTEDETVQHMEAFNSVRGDTTLDELQWLNRTIAKRPVDSLVYFVRHGEQIKIGTTVAVRERVQHLALPLESLLATEPGGRIRESELHDQFDQCRAHGEWFWATPVLLNYIRALSDYRGNLAP